MEDKKVYSEVLKILNKMPEEEINKIPKDIQ